MKKQKKTTASQKTHQSLSNFLIFFCIFLIITFIAIVVLRNSLWQNANMTNPDISVQQLKPVAESQPTIPQPTKVQQKTIDIPQATGYQLRVPILMYHYVGNNPNPADRQRDTLSISPDNFEEQMKYLSENGYAAVSLDTLYAALKKQVTLSNKPVILTFDDGYIDFYFNAYPILRKYNLHATVFILTGAANQGPYLTWPQIQEMNSSGLITFGSHAMHHYNLTAISDSSLASELSESKTVLQNTLGVPINFIAYPYGTTNGTVISAVKQAGYIGAVGTWASKAQSEGTIYNMPRLRVSGSAGLNYFIGLL